MTFIRLAGCNIRCAYCDTPYALTPESGSHVLIDDVVRLVDKIGCRHVLITGGEPMRQRAGVNELVRRLHKMGYIVSIETNGTFPPFTKVGVPDCWIYDYKLPGSGMMKTMKRTNFLNLRKQDIIKFVCTDQADVKKAFAVMKNIRKDNQYVRFAMSAASPLPANVLVEMLQHKKMFDVIVNVQIHKMVFPGGEKERK
jgi:7-carboxy-7-deazaguanine synthase